MDYDTAPDGDLLDRVADIREELAEVSEVEKQLKAELATIEAQLLMRMEDRKTDKLSNARLTASKTTSIEANVLDWDAFYDFIRTSGSFELLQKRVAVTAYREMLQMGQVPGVVPRDVTKVGFRKR